MNSLWLESIPLETERYSAIGTSQHLLRGLFIMAAAPNLLDRMCDKIRLKHCSIRTEQSYVQWVHRYILHHDKRHLAEMGSPEVEAFLTYLAVELPWLDTIKPVKKPKQLPVVLILQMRMESTHWLMAGTG